MGKPAVGPGQPGAVSCGSRGVFIVSACVMGGPSIGPCGKRLKSTKGYAPSHSVFIYVYAPA